MKWGLFVRVGPRSSSTDAELSEHEADRGEAEKSECISGEIFEILGQPAASVQPGEGAFDNPPSGQNCEALGLVGTFDDFDFEVWQDLGRSLLKDRPLISAVGKELL